MNTKKKNNRTTIRDQEGIDRLVISQADNSSAWDPPIRVKRSKPASLSIPGELEELAFTEAKKKLAS